MYLDGENGTVYAKRFQSGGVTRDKEYELTRGSKGSKVLYFSANPNSESEVVQVFLGPASRAKKKVFDFDFASLDIRARSAQGNILTRYPVKRVLFRERGASTLGGRQLWYDETTGRLNVDARGRLLGSFDSGDAILAVYKEGSYELTNSDLSHRFVPEQLILLEKWVPKRPITAVHYVAAQKSTYVKRFIVETATLDKRFSFISESTGSKLLFADSRSDLVVEYVVGKGKKAQGSRVSLSEFIDVKGWKAVGNRLVSDLPVSVQLISFSSTEEQAKAVSGAVLDSESVESVESVVEGTLGAVAGVEQGRTDSDVAPMAVITADGADSFGPDSHSGDSSSKQGSVGATAAAQDSADDNRQGIPRQLGLFD